jgi:hypothetical protein
MPHYKLVTYQGAQGPRAGLVVEDMVHDVAAVTGRASYATVLDVLRNWDAAQPLLQDAARPAGRTATQGLALRDAKLLPPVLTRSPRRRAAAEPPEPRDPRPWLPCR